MSLKISVIGPVLNEVDFIGYSILSAIPFVHEFIYALDAKSDDGTRELLGHIKAHHAHEKLTILDHPTFHPSDMQAYNDAFNVCIDHSTGDACWFLHPDMLVTQGAVLEEGPMAWTVGMTSYAKDLNTVISKGRTKQWKNIHAKKFGLKYLGGYGSANEDFYHTEITGNVLKHFGSEFLLYPFEVATSGIEVDHYCENKSHERRLEKMKLCLKTQNPNLSEEQIDKVALEHPRVTLDTSSTKFGKFEFSERVTPVPDVFTKYKAEFEPFKKELVYGVHS